MPKPNETKRLVIPMLPEQHKAIKKFAFDHEITMSEFAVQAILEKIEKVTEIEKRQKKK